MCARFKKIFQKIFTDSKVPNTSLGRHFCVCLFVILFVDDEKHVCMDVFTIHKSIPANLHRIKRALHRWHTTVCVFYHVPYDHYTIQLLCQEKIYFILFCFLSTFCCCRKKDSLFFSAGAA